MSSLFVTVHGLCVLQDDKKDEKPPVTTIFVGNISERAPDSMIRTMLQVGIYKIHKLTLC